MIMTNVQNENLEEKCFSDFLDLIIFLSGDFDFDVYHFSDTKDQWARDDPAFLVLLSFWLFGE